MNTDPSPVRAIRSGLVNHYEVLGVVPTAEPAAVRRAYLDLARRFHPDFHADAPAVERDRHARRMQQVNDAWAVLGDPEERARYDRTMAGATSTPPGRSGVDGSVPDGKGWTPRVDDDEWLRDFEGWAGHDERLPEDGPAPGAVEGLLTIAPVGLFLLAIVCGLLGMAFNTQGLLAVAFGLVVVSAALFMLLPMLSMGRRRR